MKYTKGSKTQLTANFKSSEFDCKCNGLCKETEIDESLVKVLQDIREHFGKPVTINSGYRCATHNKNVGGASSSQHLKGKAADIVVKTIEPIEVARYAESIGVTGIGLYDWGCHIDTRNSKSFWKTDEIIKVDTFMETPTIKSEYFVLIGPFDHKEDATSAASVLKKNYPEAVVVTAEK